MKKIVIYFTSLLMVFVSGCHKPEPITLQRIEYDVLLDNNGNNFYWFDHIDGFQRLELFNIILQQASEGLVRIENMQGIPIVPKDLEQYLSITVRGDSAAMPLKMNAEKINGIRFREEWKVQPGSGIVEKTIAAYCPLYFHKHPLIDGSALPEVYPLFWVVPENSNTKNNEFIITKNIAYDVIIDNSLPQIRDVYGSNIPFYFSNIEKTHRSSIINALLDAGFNSKNHTCDFFFNPLSTDELKHIAKRTDTLTIFYGDNEMLIKDSVVTTELNRNNILRLKFAEEWTFDKNTLKFSKKVFAVGLSEMSWDMNGEFKGFRFLFWLLFDKDKPKQLSFE